MERTQSTRVDINRLSGVEAEADSPFSHAFYTETKQLYPLQHIGQESFNVLPPDRSRLARHTLLRQELPPPGIAPAYPQPPDNSETSWAIYSAPSSSA